MIIKIQKNGYAGLTLYSKSLLFFLIVDLDLASDSSSILDLSSQQASFGDAGLGSPVVAESPAPLRCGSQATLQSPTISGVYQKGNTPQSTTPLSNRGEPGYLCDLP